MKAATVIAFCLIFLTVSVAIGMILGKIFWKIMVW